MVGVSTRYGLDRPCSDCDVSEVYRTHPDRPWGPPSTMVLGLLPSGGWVKRPGRGVDHSPLSGAKVKERVG